MSAKLMLIAFLPLVFLLYLGQQLYEGKAERIKILEGYLDNIKRSVDISAAVDMLQLERRYAFGYAIKKDWRQELILQREKTDAALAKLSGAGDENLKNFPSYTMLNSLGTIRRLIDEGKIDGNHVMTFYTNAIFRLNYLNDISEANINQLKPIKQDFISQKLLSEFITYFGLLRGGIYSSLYNKADIRQFTGELRSLYDISNSYETEFLIKSSPTLKKEYSQLKNTGDLKAAFSYLDNLFNQQIADTSYDAERWWAVSANAADQLKEQQRTLINRSNDTVYSIYVQEKRDQRLGLIILLAILALVLFIVSYTIRTITRMLNELKIAAEQLAEGKTGLQIKIESNDAVGSLAKSIRSIDVSNNKIAKAVHSVGNGDFTIVLTPRSADDVLVNSIRTMKQGLRRFSEENLEKLWIHTGLEHINESVAGEKDVRTLSETALETLVNYIQAQLGVMYVMKEDVLHFTAAASIDNYDTVPKEVLPGETLIGQVALRKEPMLLTDVPSGYLQVKSGVGGSDPKQIWIVPLLHDSVCHGVVELATLQEFTPRMKTLIEQGSANVAVALEAAKNREKLQHLLEQTQAQTEELMSQHSELENLNTELEAQAAKLQASEEELKVQHEELLQANQELEERSRLLEERNQLIVDRNIEIQQKARELEQSTKYKSEFLANMSHELRTPLNSILLLSRLLSENNEKNLSDDQIEYAKVIQSSGSGLLSLIDEILDLSKIEAGKMELEFQEVSVQSIASDMSALFTPVAREKKLELQITVKEGVPKNITTDKMRLEQVLKNLLSNALKFTSKGTVSVTIERSEGANGMISFSVADTGIGIAKDKQALIFEAFRQEDGSTRRKFGGTGLGLSISRQLAKLLGGEIELKSEPGEGSVFTLLIPERRSEQTPRNETEAFPIPFNRQEESKMEAAVETANAEGVKRLLSTLIPAPIADDRDHIRQGDKVILIIEDDTHFAKALMDYTRKKGYKCVVSVRGDEGLVLAKQFKPTGILLDIQLPVKDGWEVMEELKENPATRHIPVHIMSAHASKNESVKKGAIDFINKPVALEQMQEVFKKIEQVINKDTKKVLIIEENTKHAKALSYFLDSFDIASEITNDIQKGVSVLKNEDINCVILDMGIPDANAYATLDAVKKAQGLDNLPVIVFTGKSLSQMEEQKLKQYADSIVIKTAYSYQRILDEVSLFLHLVEENNETKKSGDKYRQLGQLTEVLTNKSILITDDDVRNIFSLTKVLEQHQMKVYSAMDGEEALKVLDENPDIDVVLMDIMMPKMDGYETTRRIRSEFKYRDLPIIAVTAKAMTGDREKCIEAGASDYISKPVDIDQLLSLLRVWLYEKTG